MQHFTSNASPADVTATFAVDGNDDSISLTVEGDGGTSPHVHEAIEGAVHGLLDDPVLLLEILEEHYPNTYKVVWNHVVYMLDFESLRTHFTR